MPLQIRKKMMNLMTFGYLLTLDRKIPTDPKKMKKIQNRKIRRLMAAAYQIPFYRKRFDENGLTPADFRCSEDLVRFPVLTKQELREWMKELHDQNPEKRAYWDETVTSGSTGVPLRLYQSQREHAFANANWIRVLMTLGYNPFRGRMISFESSYRQKKAGRDSILQRFGILQRRILSEKRCTEEGMPDVIRELNAYHPDLICLRKNCIVRIALYAQEHHLQLNRPKWYIPVSEMVDDLTQKLLIRTFGPGIVDSYGSDETGSCLTRRPGKKYYDLCYDTHVVNIYDDDNCLADNGRMILTPLYKTDFPIINYEIGDIASSYTKDGIRYVTHIHGRMNDMIRHEDGSESSAFELRKLANGITGIAQFRYVQTSFHDLRVELVRDPLDNSRSDEEIGSFFREHIAQLYGSEFNVEVLWKDVIPPDPNGKLRCFVCGVE